MLSLLRPPSPSYGGAISRSLAPKRSHSSVAAAVAAMNGRAAARDVNYNYNSPSRHHQRQLRDVALNSRNQDRWLSKYASVDHSAEYREIIESAHGTQLRLALEEGRGKDLPPFDPFSQFLAGMGSSDDGMGGDHDVREMIEEAEYENIEEYGENDHVDDEDYTSEDGEEDNTRPIYTNTGGLYRLKSERLALRAGYPAGSSFAVIHLAGFQHKVTIDDLLVVNKLKPVSHWSVGSTHTIQDEDILLMADQERTLVGLPGVTGAKVDVMVEEVTRDKTLIIFKKRRRKHSRRKNGFRRQVTFLRVLDVRMPEEEGTKQGRDGEDWKMLQGVLSMSA